MGMSTKNPFTWIEIYVEDMARAQQFYESVLQVELVELPSPDGNTDMQMMCFPWNENEKDISGALVKMEGMQPGAGGTLVYFACDDCATEISRVEAAGGQVLQEKFQIGEFGFCGICMDVEGNTIGFHSNK